MSTLNPLQSVDPISIVERSRLVDDVTHRLRELILTHRLPPGSRLLQTELSERLGVSRTPLREAIRLLEYDGLVRVSNGNRTVEVAENSSGELRELYEVREVIDGLAARLLARRGLEPADDAVLRGALKQMSGSIDPMIGETFFVAHLEFHSEILQRCGNERLKLQLPLVRMTAASLRDEFPLHVRRGPSVTAAEARRHAKSAIAGHVAILDAIRSGDEEQAERVARQHIRDTLDVYVDPKHDEDA